MKNETLGLGDLLLLSAIFLTVLRWTGVVSISWSAVGHFNIFVLTYLIVCFFIDLTINVIDAIIAKRDK